MSVEEAEKAQGVLEVLSGLYFSEPDTVSTFENTAYWEALAGLKCTDEPLSHRAGVGCRDASKAADASIAEATLRSLEAEGNCVIPCGHQRATAVLLGSAVKKLGEAGWPPAFVLIYDEAWVLVDGLFQAVEPTLGEDCLMEPDLNCWRLRSFEDSKTGEAYVGCNFAMPHRDMKYDACHVEDRFSSVSAWTPVNAQGASSKNGAMRVLRVDDDDYYHSPAHAYHADSETALSFIEDLQGTAKVLACDAGDVCLWVPCVVHWGGSVEETASGEETPEPRCSIAATFRRARAPRSAFGAIADQTDSAGSADEPAAPAADEGPAPISRFQLARMPLAQRLAYVAKALVAYAHWYPTFPGLDVERLRAGSRALEGEGSKAC